MRSKTATGFSVGDLIVYPAHGVGRITAIETQVMYGDALELFVISVEREGLRLMVPKRRARVSGMRPLVARAEAERALGVLSGKARGKTGTWARRAQEYEKKINSGDLLLAAEVVRDLRSGLVSGSGSYSERQIFERALDRVSRELGPVLGRDTDQIRREIGTGPSAKAA